MALPSINFKEIADTAKEALRAYGTEVEFVEQGQTSGRKIKAVVYRDGTNVQQLIADANSSLAVCILNPDDFAPPLRIPQKFDQLKVSVGVVSRTYVFESIAPIMAANTLPLLMGQLVSN